MYCSALQATDLKAGYIVAAHCSESVPYMIVIFNIKVFSYTFTLHLIVLGQEIFMVNSNASSRFICFYQSVKASGSPYGAYL